MNGDVVARDEALGLISEYGVDGAMIATAAETNPSVFRPAAKGGLASWEGVVKEYVKTAMEVENRWGNTKYLLGQMIPGKASAHKEMQKTKSYCEIVKVLGYEDFGEIARDTDKRLEIGHFEKHKMTKAERKAANKAANKAAAKQAADPSSEKENDVPTTGIKRTADMAQLDMPLDIARDTAPGTIREESSTLAA